jgi:flavorubredoxin
MPKILVLYYSRTGNTAKMAEAIAEGAKSVSGVKVELKKTVEPMTLTIFNAILIGTPTQNHNIPFTMKRFLKDVEVKKIDLKEKLGAAFGSYGWSGEAPGLVIDIMINKFDMKVTESPLLVKRTPNLTMIEKCREFGKKIGEELIHSLQN